MYVVIVTSKKEVVDSISYERTEKKLSSWIVVLRIKYPAYRRDEVELNKSSI
jgi:hypothetical protein